MAAGSETNSRYEILKEKPPDGLIKRFIVTNLHLLGLLIGGRFDYVWQRKQQGKTRGFGFFMLRVALLLCWPFVNKKLIREPFPVQVRKRFEMLGPTYIKL